MLFLCWRHRLHANAPAQLFFVLLTSDPVRDLESFGGMKGRLTTLLAWLGFLCLLFGVLPLAAMAIGYQLEAMQDKPTLQTLSCEEIASPGSEYQLLYRTFEAAEKDGVSATSGSIEKFNPQICRVAGSGTAIQWQRGSDHGFIYANLSKEQAYERLGYRTLFHALSRERWVFTAWIASFWLPAALLLYLWTGSFRLLPWRT